MRTRVAVLILLACPVMLFAQTRGPKEPQDPLDKAKTSNFYGRLSDEVRARKAFDAEHVALRTKAFRDALRAYESGKLPELQITWGEFVSSNGTVFVAMQLAPSSETWMKPEKKVVAFGEIIDPKNDSTIFDFEEPITVQESKNDSFIEKTFFLPVRTAIGTFGVAVGGEIIALGRSSIDYDEATKTSPGLSHLFVSNNIYNLPRVQKPFDPFAFGGTKVVPKPDRAFRAGDEVWLFAELRNPAVGSDRLPKLNTKIDIEGQTRKLKVPMNIEPLPLKGVDGHFGLGTTIDISSFSPGEYKVRLTITDTIANRVFQREETIRVVE